MSSPVTAADWRAQIDKELAEASFEKVLVHRTMEGLAIAPLYTELPAGNGALLARDASAPRFRICVRADVAEIDAELAGGADALWLPLPADARLDEVLTRLGSASDLSHRSLVFDTGGEARADAAMHLVEQLQRLTVEQRPQIVLDHDPIGRRAAGAGLGSFETLTSDLASLGDVARLAAWRAFGGSASAVVVSTLAYHAAGADAADEVAFALSTGVRYLDALLGAGFSPADAARQIAIRISAGRDTFLELCKMRALRACWQKVLTASGAPDAGRTLVHAVCSSRTLTARDPWVNMLRVTTQMFSAILGGADLITPASFDDAFAAPSATVNGRRVARNTGLVLREESFLGKVADPGGGSYYLETLTSDLAREAWKRFQALERDGGIVSALESGRLTARLEAAWQGRLEAVAKRKLAIVGVSEFANLDEKLPGAIAPRANEAGGPRPTGGLAAHRDAEAFEELRARADAIATTNRPGGPEAVLVTLGTLSESRPRAGFAAGFFAAGGIRSRETTSDAKAPLVCLCGTDASYATEAATRARALKAAGSGRVLLAGRPGPLEASLREAGVDGFIFVGCDVVATLSDLLGDAR